MEKREIPYHALEAQSVADAMKTSMESGLNEKEAERRLHTYGPNLLSRRRGKSAFRILLNQFVSPMVWLLAAAAVAGFVFEHYTEAVAVLVVIAVNAAIGFYMEWQARVSMSKLRKLSRAQSVVVRGGVKRKIDSAGIVPGDLLYLEAGDIVTADGRIFEQNNLSVKEDNLTGESLQVDKFVKVLPEDTVLADRKNCVFNGTMVSRGNARVLVVETGDESVMGEIAEQAHAAQKEITPLDKRLKSLTKRLIWLTVIIAIGLFAIGIWNDRDWLLMIETAIALAIAAIPEGLPVISTISLSRGMYRLSKRKVIVKSLEAVQTLGETDIIFTDKTGTITENRIEAEEAAFHDMVVDISQPGKRPEEIHPNLPQLIRLGLLCNDSSWHPGEEERSTGDPLEIALHALAGSYYKEPGELIAGYERIDEIPFEAEARYMATAHLNGTEHIITIKGAPEVVLEACTHTMQKGEKSPFSLSDHRVQMDQLTAHGLRVLCFAFKKCNMLPPKSDWLKELTFVATVGFMDPLRSDVPDAIRTCKNAGIEVIMVTGDHPSTAVYVAQQAGLIEKGKTEQVISGSELTKRLSNAQMHLASLLKTRVFARVEPSQKLSLVSLYQKEGHITAMTGDGVNDAPALKKADIGIAMGIRGTEAAREVADMILKDDAFPSIVLAIRQGRVIFRNIRNFVIYLLSCNLSEILVISSASFLNVPMPLLPLQILFLNMVTDVFPALAIGMNRGEKGIMGLPPRDPKEQLLARKHWTAVVVYGICLTISVLGIEFLAMYHLELNAKEINNVTFYTLAVAQLWNVFNLPDRRVSFFKNEITGNPHLWLSIAFCLLLLVAAFLINPVKEVLALTLLEPEVYGLIFLFSFFPVLLVQILKRLFRILK